MRTSAKLYHHDRIVIDALCETNTGYSVGRGATTHANKYAIGCLRLIHALAQASEDGVAFADTACTELLYMKPARIRKLGSIINCCSSKV